MHEKGKYLWTDGRKYEGEYYHDQKNGYGIYSWNDGRQFEGNWVKGKQEGLGIYKAENKEKLGEWHDGKRIRWIEGNETLEKPINWNPGHFENKEEVMKKLRQFKFYRYIPDILNKLNR